VWEQRSSEEEWLITNPVDNVLKGHRIKLPSVVTLTPVSEKQAVRLKGFSFSRKNLNRQSI